MLAIVAGTLAAVYHAPVGAGPSGVMHVIDGDTIDVNGQRVRLFGIDAVETTQTCQRQDGHQWPCGAHARAQLRQTFGHGPAHCTTHDRDRYGRLVAQCRVRGQDLGAWMVEHGWAIAYRKYSRAYVPLEQRARDAQVGIWQGPVVEPAAWRAQRRSGGDASTRSSGDSSVASVEVGPNGCSIKGNISKSGNRIFHVPGQHFYGRTRINPNGNERWFCTRDEALAAGWRPARR